MDGRHDVWPMVARCAEDDRRLRPDDVGAIHMGMDDIGSDVDEVGDERGDGDGVVRLVDDADVEAFSL